MCVLYVSHKSSQCVDFILGYLWWSNQLWKRKMGFVVPTFNGLCCVFLWAFTPCQLNINFNNRNLFRRAFVLDQNGNGYCAVSVICGTAKHPKIAPKFAEKVQISIYVHLVYSYMTIVAKATFISCIYRRFPIMQISTIDLTAIPLTFDQSQL